MGMDRKLCKDCTHKNKMLHNSSVKELSSTEYDLARRLFLISICLVIVSFLRKIVLPVIEFVINTQR